MTQRIAVLVSGRGSNLQAMLDAIDKGQLDAEIVGVFSNKHDAPALQRVMPALRWSAEGKSFPDRLAFDEALGDAVAATRPDWVVCAGYMRILSDAFIDRFRGRLLNIHPSLLPKYRGLRTHARALAAGDAQHGASVHFLVPELDAGTVIAQTSVAVSPSDSPDSLAQRLLPLEHTLLVATLQLACADRIYEQGDMAMLDGQPLLKPLHLDSAGTLS